MTARRQRCLVATALLAAVAQAFPNQVACLQPFGVGYAFMDTPAITAMQGELEFQRSNGAAMSCGDTYIPGETLQVRLAFSPGLSFCYLFDIAGGTFGPGVAFTTCEPICGGLRCQLSAMDSGTPIALTADSTSSVTVTAAFAAGYGEVQIPEPCTIFAATAAPKPPTPMPTELPLATEAPTTMPSPMPSPQPTPCPTVM